MKKTNKCRKSGSLKNCQICKKSFVDRTFNQNKKFCCIHCRNMSHKEKKKQVLKDWRNKNYEKYKAQWTRNNRKNKERHKLRRKRIIEQLGGRCVICGFDTKVHLHHKIQRCQGGGDKLENLVLLCPNHHEMLHRGMISPKSLILLI